MQLLKSVLVIALLTAAVVLFPLRRAQAAFAERAPGTAATPRKPARRRLLPGGALGQVNEHARVARLIAQRGQAPAAAKHAGDVRTLKHVAAAPDGAGQDGARDCWDNIGGGVAAVPQPERLNTETPSFEPLASAQSVGDIPVPPPKPLA
jgi:hypothetical protein